MNRTRTLIVVFAVLTLLLLVAAPARAHDAPEEVVIQTYVKPEGEQLDVLLRIPLAILLNMDMPKRGPGFLDLAQIEPALARSGEAVAEEIAFFEDGRRLAPAQFEGRISIPSDKGFESYETALAHVQGERLAETTDVFWNQGFFDLWLEYPIQSAESDFALQLLMAPDLQRRAHLIIRFLPPNGPDRAYDVAGSGERIQLDPRWHQAAWTFTRTGFLHVLDGIDHLLFLLCLVIPFLRGRLRPLVTIVTSFTIAHSITLIAAAYNLTPTGPWFPPLVETLIAASIVYMALENILAAAVSPAGNEDGPDPRDGAELSRQGQPILQRRWLITGGFGLVHGVGFSYGLQQSFQLAGEHLLLSLLSFNVGVELAQVVVLVLAVVALRLLTGQVGREQVVAIILSALLAHTGWHWMLERGKALRLVEWPALDTALVATLARMALVLLLGGGALRLLQKQLERVPALRKLRALEDEVR